MTRPLCVIVGAGEGLGRALAAKFASEGCNLALVSRSVEGSRGARQAAQAEGARVGFFTADATRPETIETALGAASDSMGSVEVLIYNVRDSFVRCEPLEMTYDQLDAVFRIEVMGAFAGAKAVLPGMRERGQGTILFSSATAAFRGSASHPLYAIGKFGLRGLSQSLAKAYAADGVHVAHIRLDCDLDMPLMRESYGDAYKPGLLADPAAIAETYWWVYRQPKEAWSNEVEVRPFTESWTL
jgi:NAD(P)-dependent dehydrogenase (short-subunit alcohol dehydrogenase family)